ncbi:MAG TPA: FAD-dependent monooxygenase [Candidatus Acidoferrales bacterium]|nr:FAD-dependent monooxygenase [Candidatus Acidoferrales bacterium]
MIAKRKDVFVIGGGPAGLAAAIAARQRGLRVTVADQCVPGTDKACGEGLLPETLEALARLGVEIPFTVGRPIRGIRFVNGEQSAEGNFPSGFGLGVPRTALHAIMAERAAGCGVELLWKTGVRGIGRAGVELASGTVCARWIVVADGGNSRARNWAELAPESTQRRRFGFRRHYCVRPWTDRVEVHWGDDCQFYVSPVGPEMMCVALLSRVPQLRIAEALPRFPALAARLAAATPDGMERGATCATLRLPCVTRGNVALLGDASGSVDAITGQGLFLAFSQALALADALAAGDLALYEAAHRQLALRPAIMARLLLALDGRPRLRHRVMQVFAEEPRMFARLLAAHVGLASPTDCAVDSLRFGWRLATA